MTVEEMVFNSLSQFQYTPIIFFLFGYMILEFYYKKNLKLGEKVILSILISVGLSGIPIFVFYVLGNILFCGLNFNCVRIIDSIYYSSIIEWIIISFGSLWLLWQWKNGKYKEQ